MRTLQRLSLETKTIETADSISSKILENTQKAMGMIPNMYSTMANNTALLDAYTHSYKTFRENSGFSSQEQEVIFLAISFANDCDYCMAAHSFVADKMSHLPEAITNAIRNNTEISDPKLKALSGFSKKMLEKRGLPSQEDIDDFINAGYTKNHILGVITGIGIKTMSNYFNHVFNTPIDKAFKGRTWIKPELTNHYKE
jgi:uncharacterized peroxidase-related enzyme